METPYGEIPDRFVKDMRPQEMHDFLARRYSRRSMFKGVALGAAALSPMLWRQTSAMAAAAPLGPRWIGFGADPTSQLFVSWASGTASGSTPAPSAPMVRWGLDTTYGSKLPADQCSRVPVPANVSGEPPERAFYSNSLLKDLTPNTRYHYSVSNDGVTWSPDATFMTGATGTPDFRFTAFGDQATSSATATPMAKLVASLKPAFHLIAGDLAYANTTGGSTWPKTSAFKPSQWDAYLNSSAANAAYTIPWHPTVGAHETEPLDNFGYAGFLTRFPQAYDLSSGSPVARTFTYGNVAFVLVDGNDVSAQETANTGYSGGAQTDWLALTLAAHRTAGSGIDFIVVVCNCCCYSTNTNHGSDGGLRDAWGPLFDQYAVDLVISGHVHAYERTNPIRNGQPTRPVPPGGTVNPDTDGTTYICAGGGGNGLYKSWYGPTGKGDAGSSTGPKIWRWSGGATPAGGTGKPQNLTDTATHYSAFRRAVYSCVVVDVSAPSGPGQPTSLSVRTLMPTQSGSKVTSISQPATMDSVTLVRTSQPVPSPLVVPQ